MSTDSPVTLKERYARAVGSSHLSPRGEGRTDLDVLIAAGLAARARPERIAALKVQRMAETGDLSDSYSVVEHYDAALNGYLGRKGRKPMPKGARRELVVSVLRWYMDQQCPYCGGTGRIAQEGTAGRLTHVCDGCHGSGVKPLARAVPHAYGKHALWLADEINKNGREAIKQMRALLEEPKT